MSGRRTIPQPLRAAIGSAVLVGTTHPNNVFAKQAKVADINISGKVGAR